MLILAFLSLSVFRIYLEVVGFDFSRLPLSKAMGNVYGEERVQNFHRFGLFICIGHVMLFAPSYFL